jgi:hypothetical protein
VPTFSAALQKPNGTAPRISNSWAKGKERILANEVPIHYAKTSVKALDLRMQSDKTVIPVQK